MRGITNRAMTSFRKGSIASKGIAGGFVALDTYGRVNEGESIGTALPKAIATAAAWTMVPGGIGTSLVLSGLSMAPEALDGINIMKQDLDRQKTMFNKSYMENDAQLNALSMSMNRLNEADSARSSQMARHARKFNNTY